MGCDIHAVIEYDQYEKEYAKKTDKPYNRSWWPFAERVDINRHYALFAKLAGVRNDGTIQPLSEPRGVPDDASHAYSDYAKEWDGDAHSHSYFDFSELNVPDFKFKSDDWFKVMKILATKYGADNVRLCFFFDN